MKKTIVVLLMFFSSVSHAGMIVYGEGFSFSIAEPEGWIADIKSGAKQGTNVVLYPKGQSWANAPVVMYAVVYKKNKRELKDMIEYDRQKFRKDCPAITILPFAISNDKGKIEARIFDCPGNNYEVVSYVDTKDANCLLVLSGRSKEETEKNLDMYREFVRSFMWLTSKVNAGK